MSRIVSRDFSEKSHVNLKSRKNKILKVAENAKFKSREDSMLRIARKMVAIPLISCRFQQKFEAKVKSREFLGKF